MLAIAVLALYFAAIRPLQIRADRAERRLEDLAKQLESELRSLAEVVDRNAAAAKSDVASLGKTVDHNARVANENTTAVKNSLASLSRVVDGVASLAENANRHAHSHPRF